MAHAYLALPLERSAVTDRWSADEAITHLYGCHYRSLVRLATFLVSDAQVAEEIVQDTFVAVHGAWRRIREPDRALPYLRRAVVNRSRSILRRRMVEAKHAPTPDPDAPSAEYGAMGMEDRREVVQALRALPTRQRETLVLRYYLDLSEADIARTMGISKGAVKSHAARGLNALRQLLERVPA